MATLNASQKVKVRKIMNVDYYNNLLDETFEELLVCLESNDLTYPEWMKKRRKTEYPRYYYTLKALEENKNKNRTLMDIGGSYGFMGIIAAKLGYKVYSVDNFEFFPKGTYKVLQEHIWAKYNIEMLSIDLVAPNMKLSLDDDVVDVVLFLAVIEHLPNTSRYIFQQISRVLKKRGVLILDTPNDGSLISRLSFLIKGVCQYNTLQDFFYSDIPYTGHHRCYSMKELVYMVNSCNLKILKKEQFDLVEQKGEHSFSFRKRVHKNLVNVIRVIGYVNPSLRNYNWLMAEK